MTDLESIRTMLDKAGLEYTQSVSAQTNENAYGLDMAGDILVTMGGEDRAGRWDVSTHGYSGFYAEFVFHPDGRLKAVGAWE